MLRRPLGRCASAVVEFGIYAPILVTLAAGAADYGIAQYQRIRLAAAVSAGAQYAALTGTGVSAGAIKTLVEQSSALNSVAGQSLATANVVGPACYCITGTQDPLRLSVAACNQACADGTTAGTYVWITASYTYTPQMPLLSNLTSRTLTESATVRLK